MSQYPGVYQDPFNPASSMPAKTSGMAITALVMSLVFCCPVTTVIGFILGLCAFVTIGSNPAKKGRGMALAAVVISVVATCGQVVVGIWAYGLGKQAMRLIENGPNDAMAAGFADNPAGVKAQFYGAGASVSDAEVAAFFSELEARYGKFQSVAFDERSKSSTPPIGQPSAAFPYKFTFERQVVVGEALVIFADQKTGQWIWKLGSITIHDPTLGNVTFPASSSGGPHGPATSPAASTSP